MSTLAWPTPAQVARMLEFAIVDYSGHVIYQASSAHNVLRLSASLFPGTPMRVLFGTLQPLADG